MVTINEILSKEVPISVIGLGYVGLPVAVALAKKVSVIGFDINSKLIADCKKGIDNTGEVEPLELKKSSVKFTDHPEGLKEARFHIVAVPTPININRAPDLGFIKNACRTLGPRLQAGGVVVFESTVYPGVTEEICVPILESCSGLTCGKDFWVGYSPERINPGDKANRLETIIKVVSGMDQATLNLVAQVYELVVEAGVYRASNIKVAEAAKVIENAQRDINIAFMNELSMIFDRMDIDTLEVLKAARTKWNFLDFTPGLVGGHCIGVDPYYLTYRAQQLGYHPQVILAGRSINDNMGFYIVSALVKKLSKLCKESPLSCCEVAILGLTFKENCPDVRNTRVIDIINELKQYGINPQICDPVAQAEAVKEEYGIKLTPLDTIEKTSCLIVAVAHKEFADLDLKKLIKPGLLLVDLKGIYDPDTVMGEGFNYWRL